LEEVVGRQVLNNNKWIRYPVDWPDGARLRGEGTVLRADVYSLDEMLEGRYTFGANQLFVYRALNDLLGWLEEKLPPGAMDELYDRIEEGEA
jgi:hypothetical protein